MTKLIGLSLSGCVQDISSGKVQLEDVEKIIAQTAWKEEDLDKCVRDYMSNYWWKNPEKAKEVFYTLWNSGRIEQPRLWGWKPPEIIKTRNWI